MPLITCPDCKREISTEALSCPHCGRPITNVYCKHCGKENKGYSEYCIRCGKSPTTASTPAKVKGNSTESTKKILIGGAVFIVFVTIVSMFSEKPKESRNDQQSIDSSTTRSYAGPTDNQAGIICNNFVEQRLKSPKSADFPLLDRTVESLGPHSFRVTSYVDSQNDFGANIRTRFQCKLTYKSGVWADTSNWTLDDIVFTQ